MKLHEFQAKDILREYGIPTPAGSATDDPEEAGKLAESLGGKTVIKAQVHMGGRGKAGGVKIANSPDEAVSAARDILGKRLISVQNPQGMIAEKVLVAEQISIKNEYYLAITLDRTAQKDVVMLSRMGGMDIEQVAHENPNAISKIIIDPAWGVTSFAIRSALKQGGFDAFLNNQMIAIVQKLVKAYRESDATLIEINPLAETDEGKLIAADAKMTLDDNALFRQKRWAELQSANAEDPIEAEAQKKGIAYVRLGGDIGIIGNGAGLVMCTMDEVSRAGGKPANFLDIGGGAGAERVKDCVELVLKDPNVKGLVFNIFGGITRGDAVAQGVLRAFEQMKIDVPVVIRLEGTNAEAGRQLLEGSALHPVESMRQAAETIINLIQR